MLCHLVLFIVKQIIHKDRQNNKNYFLCTTKQYTYFDADLSKQKNRKLSTLILVIDFFSYYLMMKEVDL